jgi:hypothetical protein
MVSVETMAELQVQGIEYILRAAYAAILRFEISSSPTTSQW